MQQQQQQHATGCYCRALDIFSWTQQRIYGFPITALTCIGRIIFRFIDYARSSRSSQGNCCCRCPDVAASAAACNRLALLKTTKRLCLVALSMDVWAALLWQLWQLWNTEHHINIISDCSGLLLLPLLLLPLPMLLSCLSTQMRGCYCEPLTLLQTDSLLILGKGPDNADDHHAQLAQGPVRRRGTG